MLLQDLNQLTCLIILQDNMDQCLLSQPLVSRDLNLDRLDLHQANTDLLPHLVSTDQLQHLVSLDQLQVSLAQLQSTKVLSQLHPALCQLTKVQSLTRDHLQSTHLRI